MPKRHQPALTSIAVALTATSLALPTPCWAWWQRYAATTCQMVGTPSGDWDISAFAIGNRNTGSVNTLACPVPNTSAMPRNALSGYYVDGLDNSDVSGNTGKARTRVCVDDNLDNISSCSAYVDLSGDTTYGPYSTLVNGTSGCSPLLLLTDSASPVCTAGYSTGDWYAVINVDLPPFESGTFESGMSGFFLYSP